MAFVGTSGSGKSTISLLLPRFYDVTGEGAPWQEMFAAAGQDLNLRPAA